MYRALLIGCGNIGAMYDFEKNDILTHAKGYSLNPHFEVTVFDANRELAIKVAERYNFKVKDTLSPEELSGFNCLSICSPTKTHYHFLCQAFEARVKAIICEKPISNELKELENLKSLYKASGSKVVVNYIRRFQPAFKELKNTVGEFLKTERLTNISIRYQRGFINNASHAFDLIEYITNIPLLLTEIKKHNFNADHFENDPTLSLQAFSNHINISVLGLSCVKFSYFEIDLYFFSHRIQITQAGQQIDIFKAEEGKAFLSPLQHIKHTEECLKDYMEPVIGHVYDLLSGVEIEDNFLHALGLNERMLQYLNN